jgi:deoxyribonuclease-4
MPLLGAHMSISGGCANAARSAIRFECNTLQLFTKSPSQWTAAPPSDADVQAFHALVAEAGLRLPTAHNAYLINLATSKDELYQRSIEAMVLELERAERLGLTYLVSHPGAHMGAGEEAGIDRVAAALDRIHERCPNVAVTILLETTAGQGSTLGHRFEHLAGILERVREPERLGVCFDTCHVFAAGYSLATEADYDATFTQFGRLIGLERLKVFHVNDSVKPLGSRVDRHAGIGGGAMGLEPFRFLMTDERFREVPMILETPKEGPNGEEMDPVNLAVLRELATSRRDVVS